MPQRQIARSLALWREGDRLLQSLPPESAEAMDVRRAVSELRSAHAALTVESNVTPELLERCTWMIDGAEKVIADARKQSPESSGNE